MYIKGAFKLTIYIFIILMLLSGIIAAKSPDSAVDKGLSNKNAILLKNAQFDTSIPQPAVVSADILSISQYPDSVDGYYIVQCSSYIQEEWKQAVGDTGAVIFNYVPNNAFVVRMNTSIKSRVESLDEVQWIGIYQPSYSISPALSLAISAAGASSVTQEGSAGGDAVYEDIIILLFDANDNERVLSGIENLGGEIVDNAGDIMRVRIDGSKIPDIAVINGVSWIEKYVQPVVFNDIAANITNVYEVRNTHGLTGSGQIVAVADTGLDTGFNDASMHDDIEGRIVALHPWWSKNDDTGAEDNDGHGTHVAGSVLGNGSCSNGQYAGMAPEARLVFQALQYDGPNSEYCGKLLFPIPLTLLFQEAYNDSARIHSNSWGFSDKIVFGNYTSQSQYVDDFMWKNPDMLIIFSSGNKGKTGSGSVIPPGTAKNALTVGASENDRPSRGSKSDNINEVADFSSKGPTADSRIKPDVVAPGTHVYSTKSSLTAGTRDYGYKSGTSMATPLTAGTVALIRQYYLENESIISPSAALLKATLINGAADMGLLPDEQGWGRVDIEQSLFPASPQIMCYHDDISLDASESWNVTYCVNDTSETLKITLVWTDYEGNPAVIPQLVNNLDLDVTGPSGSYLGNGGDNVNNVEQVELSSPAVGIYTVKVNGINIPQGPQPFALVISGALVDVTPPVITSATANPATIESNGSEKTTFNVTTISCAGIAYVTMNLTAIGGSPIQALDNNWGIWQYTTNTTALGTFHLPVNATDNMSCSNTSINITLNTTDTTPPTSTTPPNTEFSANTTASFDRWVLTDLHPGYYWVLRNKTQIFPPAPWTNNTNITVPIDTNIGLGDFNYTIQYNDTAGNIGTQDTVIITIIDIEPPYASGECPTDNSHVCDNTPLISVNIMDNVSGVNPASIVIKVNGSTVTHNITPVTGGYNVSNLTITPFSNNQIINVTVNATDNNSNILKHNWSFTLDTDTTPPTSNTPSDTEFSANTTASFDRWVLTDLHPGYYWVLRNKTQIFPPAPWTNNTNITVPIDTNIGLGDFNYTIQYNDTAGNIGTQDTVIITINDTVPPYASGERPANNSFATDNTPLISVNIKDNASGVNPDSIVMRVNGSTVTPTITPITGGYNVSNLTITPFSQTHVVNVTFNVSDNEGHVNSKSWKFYIDNVAPTIAITSPADGYITTASPITVSGNVNGTGSPPSVTVNDAAVEPANGAFNAITYLSLGANPIYANVTDAAGNTNSTLINIIRTTVSTTSSSGGGGGGTSGEDFNNIAETQTKRNSIFKNDDISYAFEQTLNPIIYVNFTSKISAGTIASKIEVLRNTSTLANMSAPGLVYKNINIWVGNYGWASDRSIVDATIILVVPREWITFHSIQEDSIAMYRYHNDSWELLPTSILSTNGEYVYYESMTPGFSPFAISGDLVLVPAPTPTPTQTVIRTPVPRPAENTSIALNDEISVEPEPDGWNAPLWALLTVLVLSLIATIYANQDGIHKVIDNIKQRGSR